jgi:hypothetical protein
MNDASRFLHPKLVSEAIQKLGGSVTKVNFYPAKIESNKPLPTVKSQASQHICVFF